jgi:predicted transcriptional regulator
MAKCNGAIASDNISITIQSSLLARLDRYAVRKDLNRSQIIGRAVRRFLAAELADDPAFWELYDKCEEDGKL